MKRCDCWEYHRSLFYYWHCRHYYLHHPMISKNVTPRHCCGASSWHTMQQHGAGVDGTRRDAQQQRQLGLARRAIGKLGVAGDDAGEVYNSTHVYTYIYIHLYTHVYVNIYIYRQNREIDRYCQIRQDKIKINIKKQLYTKKHKIKIKIRQMARQLDNWIQRNLYRYKVICIQLYIQLYTYFNTL